MKTYIRLITSTSVAAITAFFLLGSSANAGDTDPKFHHDFAAASAAAKEAGKPLITIFSASWCPPCQVKWGRNRSQSRSVFIEAAGGRWLRG